MHRVGRRTETVSKKKSDFFLMGECFFLTYFLIGASGGFIRRFFGGHGPIHIHVPKCYFHFVFFLVTIRVVFFFNFLYS